MITDFQDREKTCAYWLDGILIVLLFLGGAYAGKAFFNEVRTDRSAVIGMEILYGPSVMLATGRGFYQPDTGVCPELRAFLRNEVETLDPEALPEEIPEAPSSVAAYHRYLLYTVAFFLRVFGLSWSSLEFLVALMLGWCAAAAYGLFRLGMGRIISTMLALVFMLSPPILIMLPQLRDFSKAPFILTTIFLLVYFVKAKPVLSRLRFLLPLLGLVIGIGMGFRQDIIIFIPPAVVVACIALFRSDGGTWPRRAGVLVLFLVCLFGMAWPMLGRMEGGAQPYHPLVQGYSMKRMESLGIAPAAYAPLASGHDNYVFAMLYDYHRRVNDAPDAHFEYNSPGAEAAGRQWLLDMGIHFPADILTRGYASVLRSLRYADAYTPWFTQLPPALHGLEAVHLRFATFMHCSGLLLGLLVLLIIGARSVIAGLGLIIFVVYVFGYVGLQCEFRHAFHLAFIPFWVVGFLANTVFNTLRFRRGNNSITPPTGVRVPLFRMLVFILCTVILVIAPLEILRLYQRHKAKAVVDPIIAAPVMSVNTVKTTTHGWELFSLETDSEKLTSTEKKLDGRTELQTLVVCLARLVDRFLLEPPMWDTRTRFMMVEFDSSKMPEWLYIQYTSKGAWNDFSQVVHLPAVTPDQGTVRHYFPVYEIYMPDDQVTARNAFVGVGVPEDYADSVIQICQVTDVSDIRFLLHLTTTLSGEFLPLYQRVSFTPDPLQYYLVENDPVGIGTMGESAERMGREEDAVFFYCTAQLLSTDATYRLHLSQKLLQLNLLQEALEGVLDNRNAGAIPAADKTNLLLDIGMACERQGQLGLMEKAFKAAEALAAYTAPERLVDAATALSRRHKNDAALHLYRTLLKVYPENENAAHNVNSLMNNEEAIIFWSEISEAVSEAVLPRLQLGAVYDKTGNREAAKHAYTMAYKSDPDNAEALMQYYAASPEDHNLEDMIKKISMIVTSHPEHSHLAVECLEKAATFYVGEAQHDFARMLYDAAARLAPGNHFVPVRAAEALAATGDIVGAREQLTALLQRESCDSAAAALQRILLEHATEEERLEFWSAQAAPENAPSCAIFYYGCALADAGRYEEAANVFDTLHEQQYDTPELALRLRIVQMATGRNEAGVALHQHVKQKHPEQAALALQLLLDTAETLNAQNHPVKAEAVAREAIELSPEAEIGWLALGDALVARDRTEEALDVFVRAFASVSSCKLIAMRLDNLFATTGNQQQRYETWQRLAEQHSENGVVQLHWGMAAEAIGAYEEARNAYSNALEHERQSSTTSLRLGGVLACLGEAEAGTAMISQAVSAEESLQALAAYTCQNAGNHLLEKGAIEQALHFYGLAAGYAPHDPFPWLKTGEVHQLQGNESDALAAYRRVIGIDAASAPALEAARRIDVLLEPQDRAAFWAGVVAEMPEAVLPALRHGFALIATDIMLADSIVKSLAQQHPENAEVNLLQGIVWCGTGKVDAGLGLVREATAANPHLASEAAACLATIAKMLMESGNTVSALAVLQDAVSLVPENMTYAFLLGETLLAGNENSAAVEQFRKVLLKAPESPRSAQLLDEACARLDMPDFCRKIWQEIAEAHPQATLPKARLQAR